MHAGLPLRAGELEMPKIPLEKGFSQVDWIRLTQRAGANLNGLDGKPPREDITVAECRSHKHKDDAWMILNGAVRHLSAWAAPCMHAPMPQHSFTPERQSTQSLLCVA